MHRLLLFVLTFTIFLFCEKIKCQELPPINNYQAENYDAGNQNWSITQGGDDLIYSANNDGLLVFNGAQWSLYPSPDKTILRSVFALGDKIYSGSYMNFGYWEEDAFGQLNYTSLTTTLNIEVKEDEQFWTILPYGEYILFQSLNRIYIYNRNSQKVSIIETEKTLQRLYKTKTEIFFQILGEGLYTIRDGSKQLVSDHNMFKEDVVVDVINILEDTLIITQSNGILNFSNSNLSPYKASIQEKLLNKTIYSAKLLSNGTISVGTISNGVLIFSANGELLYSIDKYKGLSGNTALSLFEDKQQNLWIGLDNGIDCINLQSPYTNYVDKIGRLGTTYTSIVHENNLYLGTNQGLFVKKHKTNDDFILVEGTEGQVWSLDLIDNTLFCGHNSGTFTIVDNQANKISNIMGTWGVKRIEGIPDLLLQGNYDGLNVLEQKNGKWSLRNTVEGFSISSRYFEMIDTQEILVNHEYKGVYRLKVNQDFTKVVSVAIEQSVSKGSDSGLVKYDNKVWFASQAGLFYFNTIEDTFVKEESLEDVFNNQTYISGKLVNDGQGNLWAFTKEAIIAITKQDLDNSYTYTSINIQESLRREKKGFENLSYFKQDTYLFGTSNGYLLIDTKDRLQEDYSVSIHSISNGISKENLKFVPLTKNKIFNANANFITFHYGVIDFSKYKVIEYQYKIKKSNDATWSEWSTNNSVAFENLKFGDYHFEVRARVNGIIQKNIASYDFSIKRPWFISYLAILFYLLLLISSFYFINLWNKKNYKKERSRLLEKNESLLALNEMETQKELIQLRNEKLNQDIEARNRELAISTMSMIKKNNVLNEFKEELLKLKDSEGIKPLIKKINKSLSDTEDWDFFEKAFNHADKDFFKKVKASHPELTANDLRLCVYLRLNLSSKEIAPLLNISPRSVEIKRYRLRKKINIDREVNLNNYFIDM